MRAITQNPNHDLREAQTVARIAEQTSVDAIVSAENAHTPFPPLAAAVAAMHRIPSPFAGNTAAA